MSEKDPRDFNLPDADFLKPDQIDNVGRALITLMREVAVLNDRVLVLEALLELGEQVTHEAVDSYVPDDAFTERSQASMQQIVDSVLTALRGDA
ncbi:hypothetical protein ACRAQ7_09425 [Erythrobacter sp. W53]|uniref:hypothetical protein n=1 Tax=Erythrobacter sp. W53 TaxID=3425947 RepID=UPI003D769C3A